MEGKSILGSATRGWAKGNPFEEISPELNQIASTVVDSAFKTHTYLGPGLLESVYETCLKHETSRTGIGVQMQVPCPCEA